METTNLNVYPYFDDFDEDKNFYRILFRPGVAVQARELTQIQSLLQNQISKIGDYLFKDGSRVPGTEPASVSINSKARAIRLQESINGNLVDVNLLNGLWVNGSTNDIIGQVKFVFEKDDPNVGDEPTVVISLANGKFNSDNKGIFGENELLYFYEDRADAVNRVTTNAAYTALTAFDLYITSTGTYQQGSDEITLDSPEINIRVGDYVYHPNLKIDDINRVTFVTSIETETRIGVSENAEETIDNARFDFIRLACAPTLIVTVAAGTYYKNGTFIKSQSQSIIPAKYTRHPTKAIILRYIESIVTSDDDATLLDPAIGSTNYFAPGADRLKYELVLESIDLDEANQTDLQDTFIEVMRFVEGRRYLNDPKLDKTALRTELAKRTYDESGNYVVKEFDMDPIQVAYENDNVKFSIAPGTAYIGGYEVTTVSPTFIEVPKAKTTKTDESFNINTNYGNYLLVNAPSGGLFDTRNPGGFNALEVHSVINPIDDSTRIGYLFAKNLEYNGGQGVSSVYRLYYYYYFPATASAAPLSWTGFSAKYDIPVAEAQYVANELYTNNNALATISNTTYYGLFREPDVGGLAYWWNVWKTNSEDIDLTKELFIDAIIQGEYTGASFDQPRIYTQLKEFAETDNGSPFYDTQFTTDLGLEFARSIVGVDNTFNPNNRAYSTPAFKAVIAPEGIDTSGDLIEFDKSTDRLVFPLSRFFIQSVDRLSIQYPKTFFDQQFNNGVLQLSVGNNESFAAADGVMDPSQVRTTFIMVGTTDSPGQPLTWSEFSVKYEIPVAEAQALSQAIFENNNLITTVNNVNYYGLFREPDIEGLVYWWSVWKANGGSTIGDQQFDDTVVSAITNAQYNTTTSYGFADPDSVRVFTNQKTYYETNNGSPFIETEYLDAAGGTFANFVPLDERATVTISNNGQLATIELADNLFNGFADIIAVIDSDDVSIRTKTYNTGGGVIVDIQAGDTDYEIVYSDIAKFHGIFLMNQNDSWAGMFDAGVTYQVNDVVNFEDSAYRALRQTSVTTPRDDTDGLFWESIDKENELRYYLDDGLKDNYYNHGAIRWLGSDATAPGRVLVMFDYYTHVGEGPLTVDSYPVYDEIPVYYSKIDGKRYSLRDCIDFRPIRKNGVQAFLEMENTIVPSARFLTEADVTYYLGRRDRVYITNKELTNRLDGQRFFVDQGIAELRPRTPKDKSDATQQLLFTLELPPYTLNSDHVKITDHKINRYTMSEIGDIDRRLYNLEKKVRRQGLEILALTDVVTGGDGRQLFKAGVFIDDFNTRSKANIASPKFRAWIDLSKNECKPPVIYNTIEYGIVNAESFMVMDNVVTLPAVEQSYVKQTAVTGTLNPNPGGVAIDPMMILSITSTATGGTTRPECNDNLFEQFIGRTDRGDIGRGSIGISCDRGGILGIVGDVVEFAGDVIEGVADIVGDIADAAWDLTVDVVDGIGDAIGDAISEVGDWIFGKVVCTAMNESYGFGLFRNRIWLAYAAKHLTPEHEIGYHAIFLPLVKYAYHSPTENFATKMVKSILEHIARHRSIDLRAVLHRNKKLVTKRDTLGMIYRFILEPTCYAVGKMITLKKQYFGRKK